MPARTLKTPAKKPATALVKKPLRVHYVPVRYKGKITLPDELLLQLPSRVALFTTIQYHDQLPAWKKALEDEGKKVFLLRPAHAAFEGQLLGCGIEEWKVDADAFLYVGDGLFHPTALLMKNSLPVWTFDPKGGKVAVLDENEVLRAKRQEKGALLAFTRATKVGLLVTTKPGQQRLTLGLKLREKYPDKEFYFFLCDTLDFQGLEDYPFIECFVNTMCPRIGLDDTVRARKPIIDIGALGLAW